MLGLLEGGLLPIKSLSAMGRLEGNITKLINYLPDGQERIRFRSYLIMFIVN